MNKQLIPLENVNAIELFSDQKSIQAMLDEIKTQATDFEPDVSTPDGRKEIAAQAYKVSRSKTVIDQAGKELTAEWAKKKKVVDAGRRLARDYCDNLRDEIRQPLTDYETEEASLAAVAALKAETDAAELEAYAENDLFDREAKVRAYEAEMESKRIEAERIETERKEDEKRKAYEEQTRIDAEEKAKRDAAESIKLARQEADQAEQRAQEQAQQAERDRIAAEEREQARIIQAEADKQAAIEREQQHARDEAERIELNRLQLIERNEREAQARAADKENRRTVNNTIVDALVAGGISKTAAQSVVRIVASGKISVMTIRY